MLLLDVIIRYPTVTLLLLLAVLALRDGGKDQTSIIAALLSISVAALLLGTPMDGLKFPPIPHTIVRLIDVPSVALVWWFGRALFEDDFKLGKLEWAGMGIMVFIVGIFRMHELGIVQSKPIILDVIMTGVSILMMLQLFYIAIVGRSDDVIESRRKFRFYFVIGIGVVTLLIIISERFFYPKYIDELSTFRAAVIFPMALLGLMWAIRFLPERFSFQTVKTVVEAAPKIDPRDQSLYDALIKQMQVDKIYTEPGLSIRMLAEKLGTPEHQLRALINKGMGYRNFSGFLNQYRIEAVQAAMNQPENARIPVLTLAMDVGFNSLAPFNRAFRTIVGETPTAYRSKIHK